MVLYVSKWNVIPDKAEAYVEWAKTAIPRILAGPGVVEFRGYRPASGDHQVVITLEFSDMAAWAAWYSDEEVQKLLGEGRMYEMDVSYELWGPSPIVPEPIRPGG
jgi:antibiotic biosynthesis monooxygenase (ABM) superfamily enzyme